MNRSTVYKQRAQQNNPCQRRLDDEKLGKKIKKIQEKHRYTYGIDRVTHEIRRQGENVNHKRVARLMSKFGLHAVIRKKRNYFCSQAEVKQRTLPGNVLSRDFQAQRPGEKLVSDVTYLPLKDGSWCYVSLVKDLCTGEIVACATSKSQNMDLAMRTLEQLRAPLTQGVFHTDQGYLYTNPVFSHKLKKLGFTQSLSRKGNCLDNAVIESFNGTMKCEWFYPRYNKARRDLSFDDASTFVMEYVKYYNEERIQKKLGYLTPIEYRRQITQN